MHWVVAILTQNWSHNYYQCGMRTLADSNWLSAWGDKPLADSNWILLDTETTGLFPPIYTVEIAAQRMLGFKPYGPAFGVFVNHGVTIPASATAIHGYTTEHIQQHGIPPSEAHERLRDYVGDLPVVCHFMRYDWDQVLNPEWESLGIKPIGRFGFCSWYLARRLLPELQSCRLDMIREKHHLRCSRAHSAAGDVETLVDLFERILPPRISAAGITTFLQLQNFSVLRPLRRAHCLVLGLDYEFEAQTHAAERKERQKQRLAEQRRQLAREREVHQFVKALQESPDRLMMLIEAGLIEDAPEIVFRGNSFVFTGKMRCGPRKMAQGWIVERGGIIPKTDAIRESVNYLILGEDPQKGWCGFSSTTKLVDAVTGKLMGKLGELQIVMESDFRRAVDCEHPHVRETVDNRIGD